MRLNRRPNQVEVRSKEKEKGRRKKSYLAIEEIRSVSKHLSTRSLPSLFPLRRFSFSHQKLRFGFMTGPSQSRVVCFRASATFYR